MDTCSVVNRRRNAVLLIKHYQ
nr:unnamed protein product [Callosobruchus chinensis]